MKIIQRKLSDKLKDFIDKYSMEIDITEYTDEYFNKRWKIFELKNKSDSIICCVSKVPGYNHLSFCINDIEITKEKRLLIKKFIDFYSSGKYATFLPFKVSNSRKCFSFLDSYPNTVYYVSNITGVLPTTRMLYDKVEKLDLKDKNKVENFKSLLSNKLKLDYEEYESYDLNAEIYYIKTTKHIKGFCMIRTDRTSSKQKNTYKNCYIDYICVDKRYRHQGIATSLITHLKNFYKCINSIVEEDNLASLMLHFKCGFKVDYKVFGYYFEDNIYNKSGNGYQLSYKK